VIAPKPTKALTAQYTISVKDNKITQKTKWADGNQCTYTGTLGKDARSAAGTYSCKRGSGTWTTEFLCK